MRGKVLPCTVQRLAGRITPAYAGKSVRSQALPDAVRDHPRLCGEKGNIVEISGSITGSPPPMRGKVFLAPLVLSVIRITPAYAGKSLAEFGKTSKVWDHPRLCGEKHGKKAIRHLGLGSPPPMRGKV